MKSTSLRVGYALLFLLLLVHHATRCCAQEQETQTRNAPNSKSTPTSQLKPLIPTQNPPTYHTLSSYDVQWKELVEEGIEIARTYWGSYGPTHVWIIGYEEDDIPNDAAKQSFLEEYCVWRTENTERTMSDCFPYATERFIDVALSGKSEAYLSEVREREPRMAELVFINIHKWHFKEDPVPDPVLRGIHEYTHVAQLGIGPMPTWMMEGGAVFSEAWLPSLNGRREPEVLMKRFMQRAQRIGNPDLSIADMEEVETAPPEVAKYHRELAYDAGAWAVAFMVYNSPTRSVASLRDDFYPRVAEVGWEIALPEYVGMESKMEFYEAFERFMDLPNEEQVRILNTLKP